MDRLLPILAAIRRAQPLSLRRSSICFGYPRVQRLTEGLLRCHDHGSRILPGSTYGQDCWRNTNTQARKYIIKTSLLDKAKTGPGQYVGKTSLSVRADEMIFVSVPRDSNNDLCQFQRPGLVGLRRRPHLHRESPPMAGQQ